MSPVSTKPSESSALPPEFSHTALQELVRKGRTTGSLTGEQVAEALRAADVTASRGRGGCKAAAGGEPRQSCARGGGYAGARFPFLAANVLERETERPLFAPTFVKTIDGVRIGFIGVVTRSTPGIVVPTGVAGVRFVAEARVLNAQAKTLQADGVQAIVAVVHEGGDADGGINAWHRDTFDQHGGTAHGSLRHFRAVRHVARRPAAIHEDPGRAVRHREGRDHLIAGDAVDEAIVDVHRSFHDEGAGGSDRLRQS